MQRHFVCKPAVSQHRAAVILAGSSGTATTLAVLAAVRLCWQQLTTARCRATVRNRQSECLQGALVQRCYTCAFLNHCQALLFVLLVLLRRWLMCAQEQTGICACCARASVL